MRVPHTSYDTNGPNPGKEAFMANALLLYKTYLKSHTFPFSFFIHPKATSLFSFHHSTSIFILHRRKKNMI